MGAITRWMIFMHHQRLGTGSEQAGRPGWPRLDGDSQSQRRKVGDAIRPRPPAQRAIDLREDQVWSQNGPTGAAGDVICLSWQAPVALTSAWMIRALSPSTQDMAEPSAGGGDLRVAATRGQAGTFAPGRADLGEEPGGERRPGPAGPTCLAAVPALLGA